MTEPADQSVRERVVAELGQSFVVRAPAGSGKTGLLTQRYLGLLSVVENPEEIVAVTFTRKAAAEMRNRVLGALEASEAESAQARDAHEQRYLDLAHAAMRQDQERGWNLLRSPSRLRITTIDSLCASLAKQMPMLSRFGAQPALTEDASDLYRIAVERTIADLDQHVDWSDALKVCLQHLDNDAETLVSLLAGMLARRDQWLRHVADGSRDREELERAFRHVVEEELRQSLDLIPAPLHAEWVEIARESARSCQNELLQVCGELEEMPAAEAGELEPWKGLIELVFTAGKKPSWRKSLNDKIGFPAPSQKGIDPGEKERRKARKERAQTLIQELSAVNGMQEQLRLVRSLPGPEFEASQLEVLEALFLLLRIAAAQLRVLFGEHRSVDFVQMADAAAQALGNPEEPTDLALALEYRIQHLLVDEFQDTSQTQFELVRRLTAGWVPDDGHSLLLVGDPMQSIYRFREAEVGLFHQAETSGVGDLRPEPVRLTVNFRSDAGIVDWVNREFPQIMPANDDPVFGAVSYVDAETGRAPGAGEADPVQIHPLLKRNDAHEAASVVTIVQAVRKRNPGGSIGLLARGRAHLKSIMPALRAAGIRYRAIDIEPLGERPPVQDLLALSAALLNPADRIAWIAVLRAPWCGLGLGDLFAVMGGDRDRTVLELLHDTECRAQLSDGGLHRLDRVLPVLANSVAQRLRTPMRPWIERAWLTLGGPACAESDADLEDAQVYLQMLEDFEPGALPTTEELLQKVDKLYALPDPQGDPNLQIMTLHKSKGLEFDTVIIPGMGRAPGSGDSQLIRWKELPSEYGAPDLLVAPIAGKGQDKDPRFEFLKDLEKRSARLEDGRLLYVGATRARQTLHLLGHVGVTETEGKSPELKKPGSGSLLETLWPAVQGDFQRALEAWEPEESKVSSGSPVDPDRPQRRLAEDWVLPEAPAPVLTGSDVTPTVSPEGLEFSWAGVSARHVGTVAHRLLEHFAEYPQEARNYAPWVEGELRSRGLAGSRLAECLERVMSVFEAATEDAKGRWIFDSEHEDARNEMALTVCDGDRPIRKVIDRTFVDSSGTRWIIDYKTGSHEGGDPGEFLDRERERYQPQLDGYAAAMHSLDGRPVRLALWFPLIGGWREWDWSPDR